MNKFIQFKYIFLLFLIFPLNPAFGMENYHYRTIYKKRDNNNKEVFQARSKSHCSSSRSSSPEAIDSTFSNDCITKESLSSHLMQNQSNNSKSIIENLNSVDIKIFDKNIKKFIKTKKQKYLNSLRIILEKEDYNNLKHLNLLKKYKINMKDIILNFSELSLLEQLALSIKFNDIKEFNRVKDEGISSYKKCFKYILNNPTDSQDHTLLHCAIIFIEDVKALKKIIHFLKKNEITITMQDSSRNNVLHYAVVKGKSSVIKKLIANTSRNDRKKMFSQKNKYNYTPIELAKNLIKKFKSKKSRKISQLLDKQLGILYEN